MKTKQQKRVEALARFTVLDYPAFVKKRNESGLVATPEMYQDCRERKRVERHALNNNIKMGN